MPGKINKVIREEIKRIKKAFNKMINAGQKKDQPELALQPIPLRMN